MSVSRIFVTGATGFLGRHVVDRLLRHGHSLTLAVRDEVTCPAQWQRDSRINIVSAGPLERASGLDTLLSGHKAVVHLAGLAHVTPRDPAAAEAAFMQANAAATDRLARMASSAGIASFLHVSSLSAITPNAAEEVVDDRAKEWRPVTAYGRSKRAAEQALAAARGDMLAVSLRPPLIVGTAAPGNWAALQRLAATGLPLPFGSVDNRRSLIGVDALAQIIAGLCSRDWPAALSGSYCVAGTPHVSLRTIVSELRAGMGMPPRLYPFPRSLLRAGLAAMGRRSKADGLFGDLVVDDGGFRRRFGVGHSEDLHETIRLSGAGYARARSGGGAKP
ncbi:MAG: NAD-dependent epimerase/dehydratase family protein [Rhizobiaceae bacterium]